MIANYMLGFLWDIIGLPYSNCNDGFKVRTWVNNYIRYDAHRSPLWEMCGTDTLTKGLDMNDKFYAEINSDINDHLLFW